MQSNPRAVGYLGFVLVLIVSLFALVWGYTTHARANFVSGPYAQSTAQLELIRRCDVGDVVILGASQVGSGIIPNLLSGNVRNFAPVAGTPIDAYFEMTEIYKCPRPPRVVVLGFSSYEYENVSWFWLTRAQSGLFNLDDLNDIARTSATQNDKDLYHDTFGSEPPPLVKNWLYKNHFPPYDFASILGAKGGLRRRTNDTITAETLASGGQHILLGDKCPETPSWEAKLPSFDPNPVLLSYFDRLLALLKAHESKIVMISPPMTTLTYHGLSKNYIKGYTAFIKRVKLRNPSIDMVGPLFPVMDPCLFTDQAHLDQTGAEAFTHTIRPLLSASLRD